MSNGRRPAEASTGGDAVYDEIDHCVLEVAQEAVTEAQEKLTDVLNLLAAVLERQQNLGGAAFDPETDISWHSLYWAEGTDAQAEGWTDGGNVTTWPNETAETDLSVTGTAFTYDAAHTDFNDQPVIMPPSTAHDMAATFGTGVTQAHTLVAICAASLSRTPEPEILDFDGAGARTFMRYRNPEGWGFWAGSFVNGGTPDLSAHFHVAVFDGASSEYLIDGTQVASGNPGTNGLGSLRIGSTSSGTQTNVAPYAFVAVYDGDLTADAEWSNFKTWVDDHYGITIA